MPRLPYALPADAQQVQVKIMRDAVEYRLHSANGNLATLAKSASIFGGSATEKLERLNRKLQPLSERYDIVVAKLADMGYLIYQRPTPMSAAWKTTLHTASI